MPDLGAPGPTTLNKVQLVPGEEEEEGEEEEVVVVVMVVLVALDVLKTCTACPHRRRQRTRARARTHTTGVTSRHVTWLSSTQHNMLDNHCDAGRRQK